MRWQDTGIVLSTLPFGENSKVITLLTKSHGRHKGLFRPNKRVQSVLSPGSIFQATWNARLEDHLGMWQLDLIFSPLAWILSAPASMHCILSATGLSDLLLAERECCEDIFEALFKLVYALKDDRWFEEYIEFEALLVRQSGLPLDLSQCTVTKQTHDLMYVSPRTGNAVSAIEGQKYHDKLSRLPNHMAENRPPLLKDFIDTLIVMDYFLQRYNLAGNHIKMPEARTRFKDFLERTTLQK